MRRSILLYVCLFMRRYCLSFALRDVITKSTSTIPDEDEKRINIYLCQGETLNITCPKNFVIVFDDANFGRGHSDSERCTQLSGIERNHCDNHEQTLKVLNDKCHDQQQCIIPVDKDIFGNPCLTVTKYLYVKYHCKRKENHGM
ncbi:L-rhamnose-binding lectin CSL3-like [Mytilus trossulus]|uniref:L-rhamnose-binding lectin CSL3-like n=1 Tax=Mytilus trossulus TaxID=6551 RepID=UPI003006F3A5